MKRKLDKEKVKIFYSNPTIPNAVAASALGVSYAHYMKTARAMIAAGELEHVSHRKRTAEEAAGTPEISFKKYGPAKKTPAAPLAHPEVKKARAEFEAAWAGEAPSDDPTAEAAVEKAGHKFLAAILAALHKN